ncbi:MAG: glycerol kinase GlpK [Paracoccaceae bacterium]|nr:glycerol kinase GlpK [Paracoccaceae bacterium]
MSHVLAIDQGTTSSRAIVFDGLLAPVAVCQQEFPQIFPRSGWVEHEPEAIWTSVLQTCRGAIEQAGDVEISAIGITNQRETVVVWDRATGEPVGNAIVWQDRRTSAFCRELRAAGAEADVVDRTGLLLDPYFSGTKLRWLLDTDSSVRRRAEAGDLLFGTVDSFLIWRLTGGAVHATDATNASRTLLYNIHDGCWDSSMLALLDVPSSMLPSVRDCAADYGVCLAEHLGQAIPITGVAGDQQAATVGQACFRPGMLKSTYGTGCFALLNTGADAVRSGNRLLTTIAFQFDGRPTFALEGSIFVAGAVVQWLRDGLGIIRSPEETRALAEAADPGQEVTLVPAFTGMGAPYWDPDCRGSLFGLTRNTGPAELAKAALESVAFQTRDLFEAMKSDWSGPARAGPEEEDTVLRVDGGMTASDWAMQALADQLAAPVDRPRITETTALGAAWLAGHHAGLYGSALAFSESWALDRRFEPVLSEADRDRAYTRWRNAVERTLSAP